MKLKKLLVVLAAAFIFAGAAGAQTFTYIEGGVDLGTSFADISAAEEVRFGIGGERTKFIIGLRNYTTFATALTYEKEDEHGDKKTVAAEGYDLNNPALYLGINSGWWYMFLGGELSHYKWIPYGKSGFSLALCSPVFSTGVEIPVYRAEKSCVNINLDVDFHYTDYGPDISWKESAILWIVPTFHAGLRYRVNFNGETKNRYSAGYSDDEPVYFTVD